MLLNESDFRDGYGSYFTTIDKCIEDGIKLWFELPAKHRMMASPRSRASSIHDYIKAMAIERFQPLPNIELFEVRGLFLIKFGEEVLLRFKKVNEKYLSQNIPTAQTWRFMQQGVQEPLFGVPYATTVIAGYRTDKAHAEIQWTGITCPNGKQNLWRIDFDKTYAAPAVPIQDYQEQKLTATTEPRPKEGLKDAKQGDGGKDI